jgi:hypothetical protein
MAKSSNFFWQYLVISNKIWRFRQILVDFLFWERVALAKFRIIQMIGKWVFGPKYFITGYIIKIAVMKYFGLFA